MRLARPAALLATLAATATLATLAYAHHPDRSLYSRLGGRPAVTAVVEDFVGNVAKDNRINKFFGGTDIPRLKRLLVQQICAGSGGPCKYEGRSMREAHRGLGIGNVDFDALVQDLVKSLNKFNVPQREQQELLVSWARCAGTWCSPSSAASNTPRTVPDCRRSGRRS
jgi:hemoglobin